VLQKGHKRVASTHAFINAYYDEVERAMNPTKSLTGKPRLDAAESSFFADLQKHFFRKEELVPMAAV
jgi:hypothetical protein